MVGVIRGSKVACSFFFFFLLITGPISAGNYCASVSLLILQRNMMIFCLKGNVHVVINVYYCAVRENKKLWLEQSWRAKEEWLWLDHFNSIWSGGESELSSPENSLWAPPACHLLSPLWKRQDWSSYFKQPLCHHACLSILRSWRLFNCWAWMIGEAARKLQRGK